MNTIHIIMDTLKRSYLGCYGSDWVKTPNLDRFAGRAVVFDNAFCASFPCMPARRDFVTGNYEFPFRGWGALEETDKPVAEQLSAAGVTTGLVTDHYHLFRDGSGNYHWRYDCWRFIRGIEGDKLYTDPVEDEIDYPCATNRLSATHRKYYCKHKHFDMKQEEDWPAARTFTEAADWVRRNQAHAGGFHLQIDSFPPHEPFDPPPGYAEMYAPNYQGERLITPGYHPISEKYTPEEVEGIKALYAGTISYVDTWFGRFMDEIERLGVLEDTMVIVSTDHGTYTGDHGWTGKLGTYHYDCVGHIPMLISCPGVAPRREAAVVQNVDIMPTLLAAVDLEPVEPVHGSSLLPLLRGEVDGVREFAHSGFFGRFHVVSNGRYQYHQWHINDKPLHWHGLQPSLFVGAGPLGLVENTDLGPRRPVDTTRNPIGHYRTRTEDGRPWPNALFDLQEDPEQVRNLCESCPDLVAEFETEIRRFCAEIHAPESYLSRLFSGK